MARDCLTRQTNSHLFVAIQFLPNCRQYLTPCSHLLVPTVRQLHQFITYRVAYSTTTYWLSRLLPSLEIRLMEGKPSTMQARYQ